MEEKLKQSVFDQPPVPTPAHGTASSTATASKAPSGLPPLLPLSAPPPRASTAGAPKKSDGSVLSPEEHPKTSTPDQPGRPSKAFTSGSEVTRMGPNLDRTADKTSPLQTPAPSRAEDPAMALLSLSIDEPAGSASDRRVDPDTSVLGAEHKEPVKTDKAESSDSRTATPESEDIVDFPPLTPPPVEQTGQKLAFARPQPATKHKPRTLPQIRMAAPDETEAGKTASSSAAKNEVARAGAAKVSSIRNRLQASSAPAPLAPAPRVPPKPKTSPRGSRNAFISRKELTGKPSKLLSDSGVTVIATKTGSSQNASTDVKYVVKKQEPPTDKKDLNCSGASESTGGPLMSFSELLGSSGNMKSSESSRFPSSGSKSDGAKLSSKLITPQPVNTKTASDRSETVTKTKDENANPGPQPRPAWRTRSSSNSTSEMTTSTKAANPVQAKSSVKDFLASFSASAEEKEQDKGRKDSTESGENKSIVNLPVKSSFSRFSRSDGAGSSPKKDSPAKKSPSLDPFESLLDEPVLPDVDGDKEKEAESTSTSTSAPLSTLGSSLGSADPWSLLLGEPTGSSSSSVGKVTESAGKVTESAGKVKDAGQADRGRARLSSTGSSLRSLSGSSSLTASWEVRVLHHATCTQGTVYLPDYTPPPLPSPYMHRSLALH